MKIQIIGYSGSGKSTLARALATQYQIPCLHLDNAHFYGEWQERSPEDMAGIVRTFLDAYTAWVIDGNYTDIVPERFALADLTIFLDFPRLYCYRKCRQRFLENRGSVRICCPCEEFFDRDFQCWILFHGRARKRRMQLLQAFSEGCGRKLRFKNAAELDHWLQEQKIQTILK